MAGYMCEKEHGVSRRSPVGSDLRAAFAGSVSGSAEKSEDMPLLLATACLFGRRRLVFQSRTRTNLCLTRHGHDLVRFLLFVFQGRMSSTSGCAGVFQNPRVGLCQ